MKRQITELEKSLISKGWYLDRKEYYGKHSDKVLHYVYTTWVYDEIKAELVLNKKRDKILDLKVANKLPPFVSIEQVDGFREIILETRQSVEPDYQYTNDLDDQEIIEVVESVENI